MSVVLSEHLPLLASAPDGIQKLRGLILELAVRGKLVPQDPNDEPASELLKRIAKERARLEAEGVCRKSKAVQPVGANERPFDVPQSWAWVRLSEVTTKITDGTHHSPPNLPSGDFKYISAKNIKSRGIDQSGMTFVTEAIHNEIFARCNPQFGDVLYIKDGATTGVAAINTLTEPFSMLSSVALLKPSIGLYNRYLYFLMISPVFYDEMRAGMTGVAITRVTLAKLNAALLPLPPLAEQHRIVAKVDELMALCDRLETEQTDAEAAHAKLVETLLGTLTQSTDAFELAANWQRLAEHFDTLFTTESALDALKRTILQLAVMGMLVPQDPNDEPVSELLKRIAKERARLEAEGICKKSKPVPPVGEDEQPFGLSENWAWVRIDEISQLVTDGEHATPERTPDRSAIPLVTAKNVRDGYFDYANTDFVPAEVAEKCWKRCKPTRGDILIVSVGATLGRLAVLDHDQDMVIVRSVTVIRPCLIDRDYFALALRSPPLQRSIWGGVKQSAQPCLYLAQSSSLPVPLPPLAEQHRIVAKVDELMALCNHLKSALAESRSRQARLSATLIESALQAA